jgi:hypothetical protein
MELTARLKWHSARALFVASVVLCGMGHAAAAQHPRSAPPIFDSDPNHIWNRTYACLFVRQGTDGIEYGADVPDPILWAHTRYLLSGESHRRAIACLDHFLDSHAERAVRDPLKRAILQHDLWAVFDWVVQAWDSADGREWPTQDKQELETRLAEVLRRLALTPEQLRDLPDTYAAAVATHRFAADYDPRNPLRPFLPPDLFRAGSAWVCLSSYSEQPTAIAHFSGRSRFLVFMHLPGGRDATLEYLRKLRSLHQPPLLPDTGGHLSLLNLALPQFPVGTQVALMRQAILIDTDGKLVPTALTEDIQLRVYHAITPETKEDDYVNGTGRDQDFFEFQMSRAVLFARHSEGLVAVNPEERGYRTFSTQGGDPIESSRHPDKPPIILANCNNCHGRSGIHAVQSRVQWMKSWQTVPVTDENSDPVAWETRVTLAQKRQSPEFLLLQRLWSGAGDRAR